MNENDVTIDELIAALIAEMRRIGYAESGIWKSYFPHFSLVRNFYYERGQVFYSLDMTDQYDQQQKARFKAGEISAHTFYSYHFYSRKMDEFYLTGTLRVNPQKRITKYPVSVQNERMIDLFLDYHKYTSIKSQHDAAGVVRRYLNYWEGRGYSSITEVTVEEIRNFIVETSAGVKPATMYNIMLYLRHFHIFLKETGVPAPDCIELFSSKMYRNQKIQGYVTDEELDKILNVIDTATEKGKRDRAIIVLAATTGLRACDIIKLKLTDINWRRREICLVQAKTGNTVYVPLVKTADEAVRDYILNARPTSSDCQEVFLRVAPPQTAIQDTMCITYMFKSYQKKAGIIRQKGDGKGFHGLRRRFAKKLLVSGTPLTTISQLLGHTSPDSVRQYLSLDTGNLKECALDLKGIPVERRALQ